VRRSIGDEAKTILTGGDAGIRTREGAQYPLAASQDRDGAYGLDRGSLGGRLRASAVEDDDSHDG
jgi:hypothetical protein